MPAFEPVTITVDSATQTYTPQSLNGSVAKWVDDSAVSLDVQPTLTLSVNQPTKTSAVSKVRLKFVGPISLLDDADAPTGVLSHSNSFDVTFLFSRKSTVAERTALLETFVQLLANTDVVDAVENIHSVY